MIKIYRKDEYVIVPVLNNFLVININKQFKNGHTYIKNFNTGKVLINLSIKKELPRNYMLVMDLIRLTKDEKYKKDLIEFRDVSTLNFEKLMQQGHTYRKSKGAFRQMR